MKSIFLTAFLIFFAIHPVSAEVHFQNISFDDAKALAAKEHKVIMVDFYTTWCVWCKTLDRNTYSDDNVGKITDAKFIAVKIDAEKGEGITLAKTYKITGYPTIMFFDKDGNEIDRVVGYEAAAPFARSLEVASAGGSKAVIVDVESAHPTTDATKWLVAANYYNQQNENDKALAAFRKVLALDPDNKLGLNAEATYAVGFLSSGDEEVKILTDALQKYPNEVDADQANRFLLGHDFKSNHPEDAARRMDQWAMSHPKDAATFNYFAWTAAEKGIDLDKADEYAKRAVILADNPQDKASVMDTRAEVLYKMGKNSEASAVESTALSLLDPAKDKKLYAELTKQKEKFDKTSADASPAPSNH
jgi:thioredoxin-related protein/Tfp pilus assembly protein PilF